LNTFGFKQLYLNLSSSIRGNDGLELTGEPVCIHTAVLTNTGSYFDGGMPEMIICRLLVFV